MARTLKSKRTKYIRERQQAARKAIADLEKQGYVVTNKHIQDALNIKHVESKRQYESLKKMLTKEYISSKAVYGIKTYQKGITQTRDNITIYKPEDDVRRRLAQKVGNDWVFSERAGSISKQDWERVLAGSDRALAEIVNKLLKAQKDTGFEPDNQLVDAVWELKQKGATYVLQDKSGKFTSFKETGDRDEDKKTFYNLVHFSEVDTSLRNTVEQEIMAHPQTDPELYQIYLKNASERSFETNRYNLFKYQADKLDIPVEAVHLLTDLMNTSEVWNIAKQGCYDSDQVLSNWEHIYQDLMTLEGMPASGETNRKIDELRRDIMNGGRGLDVQEIQRRTEDILRNNGMNYRNQMGSYYNKAAATKWFSKHKQYRKSGNHHKR